MLTLVDRHPRCSGIMARALNQAARELMLAQASDWAFIMTSGTMVSYAEKRVRQHIEAFNFLSDMIEAETIDETRLSQLEERSNIFSEMDYHFYA